MPRIAGGGWLLLLLIAGIADAADPAYTTEIQKWRDDFDADVRTGGWLTGIGRYEIPEGASTLGSGSRNSMRLVPSHAKRSLGVLMRRGKAFRFTLSRGIRATIDGHPAHRRIVLSLKEGAGKLRIGSLEIRARALGEKYYLFVDDLNNPAIAAFKGNSWFEIDDSFKVPATFVAYEQPEEVRVPMTRIEWRKPMQSTGNVIFTLGGQTMRLKTFIDDDDLFIMFTDESNGRETYGGGRFIEAPIPKGGATVIDFNKAFNPYCSLNDYVMCPIPPAENHLNLRVAAGEKYSAHE